MLRTLMEAEDFAVKTREPGLLGRRVDEFLEGAKWILERDAEVGICTDHEKGLHVLTMEALPDHPRLTLSYSIEYNKVLLLSLDMESLTQQIG